MRCAQWLFTRSAQAENRYGRFTAEILKSEGLNGFVTHDLDDGGLPELGPLDIAILTPCCLRANEQEQLLEAVRAGARLVCLGPLWNFIPQLGWKPRNAVQHPGWLRIAGGFPGSNHCIQTHVPAVLADADTSLIAPQEIADFVDEEWQPVPAKAVAQYQFGQGEIAVFFYDLAAAVARIRFGSPALAGYVTNKSWNWTHACDLFNGHLDERVWDIPQADFHGQLLARVISDIAPYPLPRFWYYQRAAHRTTAVISSDGDWSTPEQFYDIANSLEQRGGRSSFYLVPDTNLPDADVATLRDRGHSFGPHIHTRNLRREGYLDFLDWLNADTTAFRERLGTPSVSLQCHCAPWFGYMAALDEYRRNGFRMLMAYLPAQKWLDGFMCGSGRPMRFVDEQGKIYDCWQQPQTTYDDSTLVEHLRDRKDEQVAKFERHLDAAIHIHHSAMGMSSHPVSFSTYSKPYFEACWDRLVAQDQAIVSGDDWCAFQDRRDAATITHQRLEDGTLSVTIENLSGNLPLIIPGETPREVCVGKSTAECGFDERLGQKWTTLNLSDDEERSTVELTIR